MQLAYKVLGEGFPLIVLHGLYGSSDNWMSIARHLSKYFKVYLIDQRNHGQSPHTHEHTYKAMANDLYAFFVEHQIPKAHILGHSMGGKTAMTFALFFSDYVEKLIVVDIVPKDYRSVDKPQPQVLQHLNIIQAYSSIDLSNKKSRQEVDDEFSQYIKDERIRQFLMKNLTREGDSFKWKINVDALRKALPEMMGNIPLEKNAKAVFGMPTLFIKGEKSDYIQNDDIPTIQNLFNNYKIISISDAGHWVHAEQPEKFVTVVNEFLRN